MTKLEVMRRLAGALGGKALDKLDQEWIFENNADAEKWADRCEDAGLYPGLDYGYCANLGKAMRATMNEEA